MMKKVLWIFLVCGMNSSFAQIIAFDKFKATDAGYSYEDLNGWGEKLKVIDDINHDGIKDIVFSANNKRWTLSSIQNGGIWIGLMNQVGVVDSLIFYEDEFQEGISKTLRYFPTVVENAGDVDNNGQDDIILRINLEGLYNESKTHLAVMFLETDLSVKKVERLLPVDFGLDKNIRIGSCVTNLGDLNGDGINELAFTVEGLSPNGDIGIFSLTNEGKLNEYNIISNYYFDADNSGGYEFGNDIKGKVDINKDGINDIIVGSPHSSDNGAIFIFFMNRDLSVNAYTYIEDYIFSPTIGIFEEEGDAHFGQSLAILGNIDSDESTTEFLGSINWNHDIIEHAGVIYVFSVNKVGQLVKYAPLYDPVDLDLQPHDHLGVKMDVYPDVNNDGLPEIFAYADESDNGKYDGYISLLKSSFENYFEAEIISDITQVELQQISVFPIPAHSFIEVESNSFSESLGYEIFDLSGRKIQSGKFDKTGRIDISNLVDGTYILSFQNGENVFRRQFFKASY